MFQVQGDAALAGVAGEEHWAEAGLAPIVISQQLPPLVANPGLLDLDHVGAEQGQMLAAKGSGNDLAEVDNFDAFERAHGRRVLD